MVYAWRGMGLTPRVKGEINEKGNEREIERYKADFFFFKEGKIDCPIYSSEVAASHSCGAEITERRLSS